MDNHAAPLLAAPLALPVALIIFRRPEATARAFAAVRAARPSQLFVIADGPRAERPDEAAQVAATRAVVEQIDWPCVVTRHYAPVNLGLRRRVESGLNRVFASVEQAIILEDDCVPDASFFPFCAELLARYAHDERVMAVTGDSFRRRPLRAASYSFSRFPHCWGWATWARAWRHYDGAMADWPALRATNWLQKLLGDRRAARNWQTTFDQVHAERVDSWALRWTYSCWRHAGLAALPGVNLVSNIGFGGAATHTGAAHSPFANMPAERMTFPLRHPPAVAPDTRSDAYTQRTLFAPDLRARLVWRLRRLLHTVR